MRHCRLTVQHRRDRFAGPCQTKVRDLIPVVGNPNRLFGRKFFHEFKGLLIRNRDRQHQAGQDVVPAMPFCHSEPSVEIAEGDLKITVEDRQLVIRGRQEDDADGRVYLHRGIAARQFQRSFVLADGVEVAGALLENGLLHVDLHRQAPDSVIQTIKISKG